MYCSNCGKHNSDDSKFCQYCGSKLTKGKTVKVPRVEMESPKNEDGVISLDKKNVLKYANFWTRLAAYCIDYLILLILLIIIFICFDNWPSDDASGLIFTLGYVIYSIFFLSTWSKTPGKSLLNLVVLNQKDRSRLSGWQAIKRSILQIFSTFLLGIGYWNMDKDEEKQAFHDKKAGTIVVQTNKPNAFAYIIAIISVLIVIGLVVYNYS